MSAERQNVNTEPTDGQKEAGNYKKGHIKVDGYGITIENPKGSTRSGKDASGKAWSVPMHYDYGYIKGTEGVDGDHIDVYLSDEPTKGNVYVVDQVNQNDGSFDEHKVMYGFPSMEAAVEAYKGQYEDGWKVGTVTEVSREDFKKWVDSSKRKTKPFADYKSVEAAAQQQRTEPSVSDIKPIGSGDFGPIYDQFKGKPNKAVKFLMSQKDGEALGALHHKEIGGISIVWGNAKAGLQKIAHKHPEVLDNLQEILDGMHVVRSSDNRVKLESGTHFAVVSRDWLGKEHTPWLLTAFEKKESSANNNSMDTAETLDGKRNDTATPRDTAFNGKDSKKNIATQEKVEKKVASSQPKEPSLFGEEEPTTVKPYYPIENGRRPVSKGIGFPAGWSLPTKDGRNIEVTKVLPGENREVSWTDGEGKLHSEEMTTDELSHLWDVAFGFTDDNNNQDRYDKDNTEKAGGAGADGGADRPVGSVRPSGDGVLGSVMNHYFAYPIIYNGKRCYVFCRAMQDANTNRLYVHEVFVGNEIKKGNTLQTAASQPHGGIALYRDILSNVLSAAKLGNSSESSDKKSEKVGENEYYGVVIDKYGKLLYRKFTPTDTQTITKAQFDKAVAEGAPHDSEQTIKDMQDEEEYLWYASRYKIPDDLSRIDKLIEISAKRPDNQRSWKQIRELVVGREARQKRLRDADRAKYAYLEGSFNGKNTKTS